MDREDLKRWRKKWGLTQVELARILGTYQVTIARWETGIRKIPFLLPLALEALESRIQKRGRDGLIGGVLREMVEHLEGPKVITMSHLAKDKAKLIREARALSAHKGHTLGEVIISRIWTGYPPSVSRGALSAKCDKCGAEVCIDPEHGVIFGEALEKDCQEVDDGFTD